MQGTPIYLNSILPDKSALLVLPPGLFSLYFSSSGVFLKVAPFQLSYSCPVVCFYGARLPSLRSSMLWFPGGYSLVIHPHGGMNSIFISRNRRVCLRRRHQLPPLSTLRRPAMIHCIDPSSNSARFVMNSVASLLVIPSGVSKFSILRLSLWWFPLL